MYKDTIHRVAALATLWLAAIAAPAQAATYYVATNGDDTNGDGSIGAPWRTIQKGANMAAAGDTVYIRAGAYNEVVTISNSGTSTQKIIISGHPGETATIDGENTLPTGAQSTAKWIPMVSVEGSYVEVRDLTVTNSRGRGVRLWNATPNTHAKLYNVKVSYCWNEGISVIKSLNATVENCEVFECVRSNAPPNRGVENWASGMNVVDTNGPTLIKGCHVHENHGEGFGDLRTDNTIIEDCVVWDNFKINIYLDNSQSTTVRRNIVYHTNNTLFWRYGTKPTPGIIIANEDYTGHSRYPNFSSNVAVYNNFVYNTGEGIGVWHQVSGSTLQNATIAYNTIVNTLTGTTSMGFDAMLNSFGTNVGVVFKNNIVRVDDGFIVSGSATGTTFSYNNWSASVGGSYSNANDVVGDPELQLGTGTPNSEWLKLSSTSPARDEGNAVSGITTDFFGTTRSSPDIGAHEFTSGSAPSAPAALNASAISGTQVDLSWSDVAGETGYRIERKTGAGSYGLLTTKSAGATSHSDATVSAATTYTYRIRAENGSGNSAWTESSAVTTPGGGSTGSFTSQDIGGPGIAGSSSLSSGVYTVNGGGWDIHGTADQFHFLHQALTGDGRIIARVTAVENTDPWAKAGLMFRDDTAANSRNVNLVITPGNGTQLLYRSTAGTWPTTVATVPGFSPPYWLRLERNGNTFTGYQSPDGLAWFLTGAATFTLNSNTRIGLAVTSHDNADLNTSTFDNVSVASVPSWTAADIGSIGVTGSTSVNHTTGVFTLNGSGSNITWTSDSFHFCYLPWTGDGTIIAEVTDVENTNQYAKGGLMIRQSLTNNSQFAMLNLKPAAGSSPGVEFTRRPTSGGIGDHSSGSPVASVTAPRFLKLVRSGNTFTAYQSADAGTWTQVGVAETVSMSGTVYIGLISCAVNNSTLCTSTFESVYVTSSTASGGAPEANVQGNSVSIADGDTTPSATDHTHFGGVSAASGSLSRTFTVQNTGSATLTLGTVSVSGSHASDFTVTTQPASSVSAGSSTTFVINFNPSTAGVRTATLSFSTNDSSENPYNFAVEGNGLGNLLANPGFETTAGWTNYPITGASQTSSTVHSGTYALKIQGSAFPEVHQEIAVTPGVSYEAKVWNLTWSTDNLSRGQMRLQWFQDGTPLGSTINLTGTNGSTWAQFQSGNITAPAGATHLRMTLRRSASLQGNYHFDDAEISIAP